MTVTQETAETVIDADEKTYCAVHPDVETGLRCNRCGRYMCVRCAVPTPVGYRCRECVNQHQDAFYKATGRDNVVAFFIALGLSVPLGFVLGKMLFLAIIFGLPAGAAIGELVWRATGQRRGRYVPLLVGSRHRAGRAHRQPARVGRLSEFRQRSPARQRVWREHRLVAE